VRVREVGGRVREMELITGWVCRIAVCRAHETAACLICHAPDTPTSIERAVLTWLYQRTPATIDIFIYVSA